MPQMAPQYAVFFFVKQLIKFRFLSWEDFSVLPKNKSYHLSEGYLHDTTSILCITLQLIEVRICIRYTIAMLMILDKVFGSLPLVFYALHFLRYTGLMPPSPFFVARFELETIRVQQTNYKSYTFSRVYLSPLANSKFTKRNETKDRRGRDWSLKSSKGTWSGWMCITRAYEKTP